MKRARSARKNRIDSDSDDDRPLKRPTPEKQRNGASSSSESDIETYLHKPESLDLNSPFFNQELPSTSKAEPCRIESDESEEDQDTTASQLETSYTQFTSFVNYTKKIEDAKKFIEEYENKHNNEDKDNIEDLLTAGEKLNVSLNDLNSSDYESYESDADEDWQEIKNESKVEETKIVPAKGLEIIVNDMPEHIKNKKKVDVLAALKRRLNRIRKDNQLVVHKVHLLCWIAHGNYVNSVVNSSEILALALSMMPSKQSFPSDRTDLRYLEQMVGWYKKSVQIVEKPQPSEPLEKLLEEQMKKKEVYNKKMLAIVFVAILRSFGIQARLVMSLQVEPLTPPASALHSLSTKKAGTSGKAAPKRKVGADGDNKSDIEAKRTSRRKKVESQGAGDSQISPSTSKDTRSREKSEQRSQNKTSKAQRDSETKTKVTNNEKLDLPTLRSRRKSEPNLIKSSTKDNNKNTTKQTKKHELNHPSTLAASTRSRRKSESNSLKSITSKTEDLTATESSTKTTKRTKKQELIISQPSAVKVTVQEASPEKANNPISTTRRTRSTGNLAKEEKPKSQRKVKSTTNLTEKVSKPRKSRKNVLQVDGAFSDSSSDDSDSTILPQLDGGNNIKTTRKKPNLKSLQKATTPQKAKTNKSKPNLKNLRKASSDSEFEAPAESSFSKRLEKSQQALKKLETKDDVVKIVKNRMRAEKEATQRKMVKTKRKSKPVSESDSDYEPIKRKHHDSGDDFQKTVVKRRVQRPILSDDEPKVMKKIGNDVWVEVFLESEEKWISVDVVVGKVHCINELAQRASHPISYVLAWDNNNNLKDISQRYCKNFNTVTRKLRIDQKWWEESLAPFKGLPNRRDREEDNDFLQQQLDQPLPKSISEYKNHPLYALKRHLLKFEAIYPPEPATVGFVRGEPVYPRSCIYTLHSRDIWLKQAKVVKIGEKPYKIVKARPKWDKLSNKVITDQLLDIFGPWQVEDYVPPTAENGIVPKNAFGNVDLFKACMLPKGCVHLRLEGLNRVARRLNIDCATAIIGFDFHGGWSHPVYDGFVVCEEFEDHLKSAWEKEQVELVRKEQEKIDKRVYGNWKRLIRGLLIRERLKAKYDFGEASTNMKHKPASKKK